MTCLYTEAELIEKIKALDAQLEKAIQSSKLDTNQGSQSFAIMPSELRRQRAYYLDLLNRCYGRNNVVVLNAERCT